MRDDERRMTFIVVPHGAGDLSTRSFEISYRRLRLAAIAALVALILWVDMAASYGWVLAQAARVPTLNQQVERLQRERQRVLILAEELARLERSYEQVRSMLGAGRPGENGDALPLPPSAAAAALDGAPADDDADAAGPPRNRTP